MAWVSWSQSGTRCQRENSLQIEGFAALSDPRLSNLAKMRKKYCWVNIAVCPRLQLISHTQPTSTLSRIKCERYIFIKKCIHLFIEVRILCLIMFLLIFVLWLYNITNNGWYAIKPNQTKTNLGQILWHIG